MPHLPIPMMRNDGRQPRAVQGLPAYGRLRERWLASPMPTATAAATHGQRRRIGAGAAPLLLVLLLRPVVSLHSAGLRSKSGGLRSVGLNSSTSQRGAAYIAAVINVIKVN